ncbi:hypothetical protein HRM2_27840 [Desulforapulum autotrophicum HRM2]|uniref:LPS export ABC transporter periplasmic protein LptC n=1 Tax=Desulforapulum autotrophicum (strain ATCC 43914 / DSM 3382 / VKM B-1955 / HRM2) TaxID=177437 RepID=C0QJ61_DESAH|nr:LPS export ABC transporter periplasmic protein LptC [Desulforapulum autotrophicum]ACN15874.1 hypothetical protein HRM2_27840 [Desulforapulum autotrophicum HRM2]
MKRKINTPKRVRIVLVLLLFFLTAGIGGLYYKQRFFSGDLVLKKISVDSKATLLLNKMHQTSTRNSIKEWTLDASSAKLLKDENKAQMTDVRVVFFTDNAKEIHLSSTNGLLDTKTHDMSFSDNVVVTYDQYTLKTAELHYDKKRHILYSNVHISIMDKESILEADTMETDLDKNTTRLRGNVKGTFSETFNFFNGMGSDS